MLSGAILAADEAAIGWWGLAGSFALVAVAVALSLRGRLGLERSMLWASARAVVQLLAVGSVLGYLLDPDRPIALATSWVVVMVLVAAITIRNRAPEVPGVFWLGLASVGLSTALGLALLFVLGIFPLEGKTIVPLAGMIVGNAMAATIVAARRILGETQRALDPAGLRARDVADDSIDLRVVEGLDDHLVVGAEELECGVDRAHLLGPRAPARQHGRRECQRACWRGPS